MADDIYSMLAEAAGTPEEIVAEYENGLWTAVETVSGFGMCMSVPGGRSREIALINSALNRGTRYYRPFDDYYAADIDFAGKTVGVVGHLKEMVRRNRNAAKKMYVFELDPKDEMDLPAELEDELLPECDIVVITGSSLVNGTLPHILELCPGAYKILTGPSVPQCEGLLDFGIDRLAGLCVTDIPAAREYLSAPNHQNPYSIGHSFLIKK